MLTILTKIKKKLCEEKLYEEDETESFCEFVILPNDRLINLIDAIDLILDFHETIQ